MTAADFLVLTRAEQNAEVARWMGWEHSPPLRIDPNTRRPCPWRRRTQYGWRRRPAPPHYVSGGWAEFGEVWEALPSDGGETWFMYQLSGGMWLIEASRDALPVSAWSGYAGIRNLTLALALGKALGKLKEAEHGKA